MSYGEPLANHIRWLTFRNDSGETVPPFAVLKPTGMAEVDSAGVLTIDQCDEDGYWPVFFNGPMAVADGKFGSCTGDLPCMAYYDNAATPAAGEFWGAKSSSWKLTKGCPGFEIATTGVDDRVIILPSATAWLVWGKTDAAVTTGNTVTVSVWNPVGTPADTGINITAVMDRYADLDSGVEVHAARVGRKWMLIAAAC